MATAITQALKVLDSQPARQRELYVVCDTQAASWTHVTDAFASAWQDRMAARKLARFQVVCVGSEGAANVALRSVTLAQTPAIRGVPNRLLVRIRNHGDQPRANVPVVVSLGERELARQLVNLSPGAIAEIEVPVTFSATGPQVIGTATR